MAKINFKTIELRDLAGMLFKKLAAPEQQIECPQCAHKYAKTEPVTVADVIVSSLLSEDPKATPLDKYKYFKIADKIKSGEEVELTLEELALIKAKVGENPNPVVVGRVYDVLENLEIKK